MSSAATLPMPSQAMNIGSNGSATAMAAKYAVQPARKPSSSAANGKPATSSSDDGEVPEPCAVCAQPTTTKCSNCKRTAYCSTAHQKADWKQHKPACHPFCVERNATVGRHLVASRPIRAGEIVLRERALVRGPAQITAPVCVGCLQAIDEQQIAAGCGCSRCGWPVCSAECETRPEHRAECQLTVDRGMPVALQHYFAPHPTYQCVTALRCLLLRDNPDTAERWSELQQLESHCEQRRGTVQWRNDREGVARFIPRFFRCPERWSEEEILRVAGIVQINGHEVPLTEPGHVAIYRLASLVQHSCRPNLTKSFTAEGEVVFWAADAIAEGAQLSICYSDVLWGTANRQHHLQQTKMFRCECERCIDVTEHGSMYSAIRCRSSECEGLMLPASLDGWEGEWTCNGCAVAVPYKYVAGVLERAGRDLEAMEKDKEENCIRYLEHYGRWLPVQHYMMTDVRIALVQMIGIGGQHVIQSIAEERLLLKIRVARELLQLFDVVARAEARILGAIHFELHTGLAELGRRGIQQLNEHFRGALEESLHSAEEVMRLLQHEPIELSEGQLCAQALRNAESLRVMLASSAAAAMN